MTELKNCPLCGGKCSLIKDINVQKNITTGEIIKRIVSYWVKCDDCEVSSFWFLVKERAIFHWNKRYKSIQAEPEYKQAEDNLFGSLFE